MSQSMGIHDLPEGEKPREKMSRLGAASLGDDELLAIFLRTGVKGENAIAVGRRLLNNHGGLSGLARTELPLLAKEHGLGLAKACQLAAAFEVGNRLAQQSLTRVRVGSPQEIYDLMGPQMRHLRTESLRVLVMDTRLRCITVAEVSRGSSNETLALVRDVIRPVILHQATTFAIVHNHPSGDPEPSRADVAFTNRLVESSALFELHLVDHLVIGSPQMNREGYYSFRENNLLKT